jgi:hypothetical protein
MKSKPKKCKGIGRAKAHPGCGELSHRRKYGLCPYCLIDWAENFEEGKEWMQKQFLPKAKRKAQKTRKKNEREQREKLKSIRRLINEARTPFQKWIRFRDANDPCISCGSTTSSIWDAGHYLKAELYTGLIFDETNVNKQCRKCNSYLGGNESAYRVGLVKKYGEKKVKALELAADKMRTYRYSREELIDLKKRYQKRLRDAN